MPLFICKCVSYTFLVFPKSWIRCFFTVRGAVQGSFRATFGIDSFFVHVVSRLGWVAIGDVFPFPLSVFFFRC